MKPAKTVLRPFVLLCLFGMFLPLSMTLNAQEPGERRRRERPPEGGPPWMRGTPEDGPPWMRRDRGPRDAEQGSRGGNEAERNERMLGMLRAMDTNGNGRLEPNEIPEYRRRFVESVVTRMGGDPGKTIDLNDLARRSASRSPSSGRSGGTTSTSAPASRSSATAAVTDPLVPVFGEKVPETSPVLPFGQREPEAKTAPVARQTADAALGQSDRILRQAREIMSRYDKNKNGTLDKDKGEWLATLPFNPDKADKNRDGRISMSELIEVLGGKTSGTSGAAAVSTRPSSVYDRLPPGIPDWFFERDKDQDGQLTMLEYANGQTWTEAVADEFRFLDKNNDGTVTIAEMFETLKQVDEEKRLKEEKTKRELERRKGVGAGGQVVGKSESKDGKDASKTTPASDAGKTMPDKVTSEKSEEKKPGDSSAETDKKPQEASPNWQPSSAPPKETPASAPYSSGSSDSKRPSHRRGGRSR